MSSFWVGQKKVTPLFFTPLFFYRPPPSFFTDLGWVKIAIFRNSRNTCLYMTKYDYFGTKIALFGHIHANISRITKNIDFDQPEVGKKEGVVESRAL